MNTVLTCISCGAELPALSDVDSGFCPHCGVSLVEATPVHTPVPPRPDGSLVEQGGPPGPPPRRPPPLPPARGPMETNPFSAEVEKGPKLEVPFFAAGGLIHDENTPPIPTRADGVFTSVKPELSAELRPSTAIAGRPLAPRPPTPKKEVSADPAPLLSPFGASPSTHTNVMQKPAVVPLVARAGMTAPTISDAHAEFRKGRWRAPVVVMLVVAAAVGLFFVIPSGQEGKKETATSLPKTKAVIGTSNSPEIIEEPEREDYALRPSPAPQPVETPKSDLSRFADDFKSKAGK